MMRFRVEIKSSFSLFSFADSMFYPHVRIPLQDSAIPFRNPFPHFIPAQIAHKQITNVRERVEWIN